MQRSPALERLGVAVALLLVVWGIGSFGFWDPWELAIAEAAQAPGADASMHTRLSTRLIELTFGALGAREWSARLPGAAAAVGTCLIAFALLHRLGGGLAAVAGTAVLLSTPMFLLDARLMMGASVEVLAQTWVGAAALAAFFSPSARRFPWAYVALGVGLVFSTLASGVLLGPLPPVLAVVLWSLLSEDDGRVGRVGRWLFPVLALVLVAGVVHAVRLDDTSYSVWLGGGAVGGNPPTFEKAFEVVFHGFAPWSAVLPVAAVWALGGAGSSRTTVDAAPRVFLLWAAFSFVSWTVFASRYGAPAYLAVVPLAALVALWLDEVTREPRARWPSVVAIALFVGLLIRDYALYPESPLRALRADGLDVPDVYDPTPTWTACFVVVGVLVALTLVSHPSLERPSGSATVKWLRAQWRAGGASRGWLFLAGAILAGCLTFGLACWVVELPIASVGVRIGRVCFFVPFVVVLAVIGLPWLRWLYGRLGALRVLPPLAGGLAVGAFVALSFQPALSQHFSPKPVYEAYAELAEGRLEPLATYKVSPSPARYYTRSTVTPLQTHDELEAFFAEGGQRWAVIEAGRLPTLDRVFRRETGHHLYVADARSVRLLLVAAQPVEGRANQSFLASTVLGEAPVPERAVRANFDDRIELIGYDLDLPGGDSVGAGQRFGITWYWRALAESASSQQVFVHIDGFGLRLNGDHVPVDGKYPTSLWLKGDVIVDSQTLTVPANYQNGDYTIYVGLFRGSKRLEVKSGTSDDANRVDAGLLSVR